MTAYMLIRPPWGSFSIIRNFGIHKNLYQSTDLFRNYGALTYNYTPVVLGSNVKSLPYSSDVKKSNIQIHKTIKRSEILQDVLEKNKSILKEKRDVFVEDMRKTKTKVKEKMEEVIERENVLTIPNLLCVGRAFLAPYLGYVIIQQDFNLAMALLVAAGVSDLVTSNYNSFVN